MSNDNSEPVERRVVYATQHEPAEQRSDPQLIIDGAQAVAELALAAAAWKAATGGKGSEQPPPTPQQSPPPPAEPQAGKPSE